jgi:hypothetical protein
LLLYDVSYWESYVFNQGTSTLTRKRQHLIFRSESDYLLKRIVEAKIEDYNGFLESNYRGIILILSNGEKIILNRRLLESISNGKREEKILAMIAEKLNLTQEDLLI